MRRVVLIVLFLLWMTVPVFATTPSDDQRDIPTLIERFINENTKHGAPRVYTWVIEEILSNIDNQLAIEVRIVSASIDRKTVDDDRYRILFVFSPPTAKTPYGVTEVVGYSKLSSVTGTCEEEKT